MRIGRFQVTLSFIEKDIESLVPFFEGMVVIDTVRCLSNDNVTYTAYNADFRDIEKGSIIPWYLCSCKSEENVVVSHEWIECKENLTNKLTF